MAEVNIAGLHIPSHSDFKQNIEYLKNVEWE